MFKSWYTQLFRLRVGMAIHAGTGGSEAGLALWDEWSRQSEKYRSGECLRQWRGFKAGGKVGIGTLLHMAGHDSPGFRSRPDRPDKPWPKTNRKPQPHHKPKKPQPKPKTYQTAEEVIAVLERQLGPVSMRWEYLDAEWVTCGYVLRWDLPDGGKTYRPVSRGSEDSWYCGAMTQPKPLYNLPYIRDSGYDEPVIICEGEKDCVAMDSHGLLATTSSGGAGAANHTDWTPLAGREVIICPDNDSAGERYAEVVTEILQQLNPPAKVRVMPFPAEEIGSKCSAADWLIVQLADDDKEVK